MGYLQFEHPFRLPVYIVRVAQARSAEQIIKGEPADAVQRRCFALRIQLDTDLSAEEPCTDLIAPEALLVELDGTVDGAQRQTATGKIHLRVEKGDAALQIETVLHPKRQREPEFECDLALAIEFPRNGPEGVAQGRLGEEPQRLGERYSARAFEFQRRCVTQFVDPDMGCAHGALEDGARGDPCVETVVEEAYLRVKVLGRGPLRPVRQGDVFRPEQHLETARGGPGEGKVPQRTPHHATAGDDPPPHDALVEPLDDTRRHDSDREIARCRTRVPVEKIGLQIEKNRFVGRTGHGQRQSAARGDVLVDRGYLVALDRPAPVFGALPADPSMQVAQRQGAAEELGEFDGATRGVEFDLPPRRVGEKPECQIVDAGKTPPRA